MHNFADCLRPLQLVVWKFMNSAVGTGAISSVFQLWAGVANSDPLSATSLLTETGSLLVTPGQNSRIREEPLPE